MTFFTLILYPVLNKARLETSKHCQTPDATIFRYTYILDKMLISEIHVFVILSQKLLNSSIPDWKTPFYNTSQTSCSFIRYQALEYLNRTKKHPLVARYSARMLWGFRLPPNVFIFSDQIIKLCNFGNFRAKLWCYLLCFHHIEIFASS